MANIIGKVQGLEGKFFAKDTDGNIVELKNGDEISQGMSVFGDKENSSAAHINIVMADTNEMIVVSGAEEQLFDASLYMNEDMDGALAEESILDAVEMAVLDETEAGEEDLAILDETAAGEEQGGQTRDGQEADFHARNGDATDIVAGLRDAQFDAAEPTVEAAGILLEEDTPTEAPTVSVTEEHTLSKTTTPEKVATQVLTKTETDNKETVALTKTETDNKETVALTKTETDNKETVALTKTETDNKETVTLTKTETDNDTTLFTAHAYEGDGYESFENAGNITAANAAVTYDANNGLGVGNQNGKDNANAGQTKAFEENESLLIDFGKEIDDVDFSINTVAGST